MSAAPSPRDIRLIPPSPPSLPVVLPAASSAPPKAPTVAAVGLVWDARETPIGHGWAVEYTEAAGS